MNLCLPYWKSCGISCGMESGHPGYEWILAGWCQRGHMIRLEKGCPSYVFRPNKRNDRNNETENYMIIVIRETFHLS